MGHSYLAMHNRPRHLLARAPNEGHRDCDSGSGAVRGAYKIGLHRGSYEALVQRGGRVRLYRDANMDDILDMEPEDISDPTYAGIKIHRASTRDGGSENVDKWSAGCQVFADRMTSSAS